MNGLTFVPLGVIFFLLIVGYLNRGQRIRLLEGQREEDRRRMRALESDAIGWRRAWLRLNAEYRNSAQ